MDHLVEGPDNKETSIESAPDVGRVTIAADLAPGERLRVVKFLAYGSSSRRSLAAVRDAAVAALAEARHTGWDGLLEAQRAYLDDFWRRADVELEGDTELQQAVRFALFHTLQAGARAEQRAIGAKGLTGPGYDGHTFWDTERFVLPVLTYTAPRAAADALRWRHSTLDLARERARSARPRGRRLPVAHDSRTRVLGLLAGRDGGVPHRRRHRRCRRAVPGTPRRRAVRARGRARVARRDGAPLALARPPRRSGTLPHRRRHRPGRVQRDRRQQRLHQPDGAAEPACRRRLPSDAIRGAQPSSAPTSRRRRPGATRRESMVVPWDDDLGVHPQSEGFTDHQIVGLRRNRRLPSTRCCCTSPTSTSTASRSSSRPISCSPCTVAATPSPTRRRRATSPTTRR